MRVVVQASYLLLVSLSSVGRSAAFSMAPDARRLQSSSSSSSSSSRCEPSVTSYVTRPNSELFSATGDSMSNDKMERKVKGRKQRVLIGYRITALSYLTYSGLALKKSGLTPFSCYTVAGPILAAGMAYILSIAAQKSNDKAVPRLASPTYKRLNIVLGKYGAIGLILSTLVPQTSSPFWVGWTIFSFITMVNSIKGYGYGLKGWKLEGNTVSLFKDDIIELTKGTAKTIFGAVRTNLQSTAYLASTLTVGTLMVMKLVELVGCVVAQDSNVVIASRLSRFAKLYLLTGASFTLTDGAMRGRLAEGSTYNQLNFLSAFCFGTMAVYLKAQSAVTPLVKASRFFALLHVLFGCLGLFIKKKKEDYHDEVLLRGLNAGKMSDDFPLEDGGGI